MKDFLFPEIWKMLEEEKYDDVIKSITPMLKSTSDAEVKEANKLLGMAYFKQTKYPDSVPFFEAAAINSKEVNDWFNIVTSSTLARQIEKGAKAFDKALEIQIKSGYIQQLSIPFMRQYYACALRDIGNNELALNQINELRIIYEQLNGLGVGPRYLIDIANKMH